MNRSRLLGGPALALALIVGSVAGCGGSTGIKEGAPKNIDMSKDYSPKVNMPGMSPKDASKAAAANKEAGGGGATGAAAVPGGADMPGVPK